MKISKLSKNQSGAAAVEFAIVIPVLLLMALGSFEFGLLFYNKQVITNAAREGARAGIVLNDSDFKDDSAVIDIVKNYCENRLIDFGGNANLTNSDILLSLDPSGPRQTASFGDEFSVSVEYEHHLAVPSFFDFLGVDTTITITSLSLMRMEQKP